MAVAVGGMGIPPGDFRWMTVAELIVTVSAWSEKRDGQYKETWERERWSVVNLINIQLDPKDRQSPEKMFPFPWDKKTRKRQPKEKKRAVADICAEARQLAAGLK